MGELRVPVSYNGVSFDCPLIILDCTGPSLCGRDLIAQISKSRMPIFNLRAQPDTHSGTTTSAVEDILAEFQDVFQPEVGVIDGPPVRLLLKKGATPKFYHQPLLGLLKSDRPTPPLAAARIQRWALYLGGFYYRLQYCPGSTKTDEWTVPADVAVHVRNYGQGDKWTPGRTASVSGARMVTIDTPEGPVRRHVDQVRSAQSSPGQCEPIPENKEETEPSTKQVVSPVRPPVQGPTQDTPPADAGEVPLRRSKRQRKPPQRLYNLKGREM
ncbi:uncharacterized protein LOC119446133 [Dermacentor silvarum]|uniref:uncharacterized protein LOC119446133 n=1 Tax=Dermacentor silvarum TaxID=543639 RepID=UPI002101089A|nr:uncharacterized protein LOC119446133 [Dermacentor silvarum]